MADNLGKLVLGHFGIFGQFITTQFGAVSLLPIFSTNQPLFYKKRSLYIQVPNINLGLGL
jgi:hypothetical protein